MQQISEAKSLHEEEASRRAEVCLVVWLSWLQPAESENAVELQVELELARQRAAEAELRAEMERTSAAKAEQESENERIKRELAEALDAQRKAQEAMLAKLAAVEKVCVGLSSIFLQRRQCALV
jgi:transketolase